MQLETLTAGIIIIGNEILSGKTQDLNVQFLAIELANLGIKLKEVRVVPDTEEDIIFALNELRKKYTYIFTTGGIGPTHDDITAETIAKAFNKKLVLNEKAKTIIEQHLRELDKIVRPDHIRMAYMPETAELLLNKLTGAPGFKIENVFVMAGVPYIMQSIFEEAKKHLRTSQPIISLSLETHLSEAIIASSFRDLQNKYPEIEMGSYPFKQDEKWRTTLVLRGNNSSFLEKIMDELKEILAKFN